MFPVLCAFPFLFLREKEIYCTLTNHFKILDFECSLIFKKNCITENIF